MKSRFEPECVSFLGAALTRTDRTGIHDAVTVETHRGATQGVRFPPYRHLFSANVIAMNRTVRRVLFGVLCTLGCSSEDGGGENQANWTCYAYFDVDCICEDLVFRVGDDQAEETTACVGYEQCVSFFDQDFGVPGCYCGPNGSMVPSSIDATDVQPTAACPPTEG